MENDDTDRTEIQSSLHDLEAQLSLINLEQAHLDVRRTGLERKRSMLLRELTGPYKPREVGWVKVYQAAPCIMCGHWTEWRNLSAKPEHRHSNCPHFKTPLSKSKEKVSRILDGLVDGSINPEDLL